MSIGILLTIIFVVLKLCGVIAWSWWWVAAPALVEIIVSIVTLFILLMFFGWSFGR